MTMHVIVSGMITLSEQLEAELLANVTVGYGVISTNLTALPRFRSRRRFDRPVVNPTTTVMPPLTEVTDRVAWIHTATRVGYASA